LTQKEVAELSGISQAHISFMESGKMAIGVARAKRLAKALNTGYKVFYSGQTFTGIDRMIE